MRTPLDAIPVLAALLVGCASDPPRQLAPEPAQEPSSPAPRPRPRPEPATPAAVDSGDPWARCKPGAEFVQRRVMTTKPPLVPVTTEARLVVKVVSMDAGSVSVETRIESTSAPPDQRQETVPRGPRAHPPVTDREESTVTVPAGTFPCVHLRSTIDDHVGTWTFDEWYDTTLPVPYKIVVDGPRESQTVELESFKLE